MDQILPISLIKKEGNANLLQGIGEIRSVSLIAPGDKRGGTPNEVCCLGEETE